METLLKLAGGGMHIPHGSATGWLAGKLRFGFELK